MSRPQSRPSDTENGTQDYPGRRSLYVAAQRSRFPRCASQGCKERGTNDVDTIIGSVYVCDAHVEEALAHDG